MSESKIIMSEELQGLIPELEDESFFEHGSTTIVQLDVLNQEKPFHGPLISLGVDSTLDVELLLTISKALAIHRIKDDIVFQRIKIIYRDESVVHKGPFHVHASKIHDVKQPEQICTLKLSLVLPNKQ